MFADFLPHGWLFAHAACASQHGGIGSIARALRLLPDDFAAWDDLVRQADAADAPRYEDAQQIADVLINDFLAPCDPGGVRKSLISTSAICCACS